MGQDRVLLTGASGYIGGRLAARLVRRGLKVYAVTRDINRTSHDPGLHWVPWSELDAWAPQILPTSTAVIHLATEYGRHGVSPVESAQANVIYPLRLMEAAAHARVPQFINTDTFFSHPRFEYRHLRPYVLGKRHFRDWGEHFSRDLKAIRFVNMRLEHVYGPGQPSQHFIPSVLDSIKQGKRVALTAGTQRRDFVYVDDVVDAYLSVLDNSGCEPELIEIGVGTGTSVTIRDFVSELADRLHKSHLLDFGAIAMREGEIPDSRADLEKLKLLGWSPRYDYKSGIEQLLTYMSTPDFSGKDAQ